MYIWGTALMVLGRKRYFIYLYLLPSYPKHNAGCKIKFPFRGLHYKFQGCIRMKPIGFQQKLRPFTTLWGGPSHWYSSSNGQWQGFLCNSVNWIHRDEKARWESAWCFFRLNSLVAAPLDGCGECKGCRVGCFRIWLGFFRVNTSRAKTASCENACSTTCVWGHRGSTK